MAEESEVGKGNERHTYGAGTASLSEGSGGGGGRGDFRLGARGHGHERDDGTSTARFSRQWATYRSTHRGLEASRAWVEETRESREAVSEVHVRMCITQIANPSDVWARNVGGCPGCVRVRERERRAREVAAGVRPRARILVRECEVRGWIQLDGEGKWRALSPQAGPALSSKYSVSGARILRRIHLTRTTCRSQRGHPHGLRIASTRTKDRRPALRGRLIDVGQQTDPRHGMAWHHHEYAGRARPWDSLIGLIMRPRDRTLGLTTFFILGHLVGREGYVQGDVANGLTGRDTTTESADKVNGQMYICPLTPLVFSFGIFFGLVHCVRTLGHTRSREHQEIFGFFFHCTGSRDKKTQRNRKGKEEERVRENSVELGVFSSQVTHRSTMQPAAVNAKIYARKTPDAT
ncbi:hypothetical protein K438DRAFT_1761171 [Mycena galopus ATCC 62051]|nr:hypothetical protein K438DRAFT_1761171 [Mycena galopus ATCC 62051]